jgi:hypothetical protein
MAGFGISDVEPCGSSATVLVMSYVITFIGKLFVHSTV